MANSQPTFIERFLKEESSGGLLLVIAALVAIILANTPLVTYYDLLLDTPVAIKVGTFEIAKPLLLWVNDGLMAIFFLLVGLELKREFLEGELSDKRHIVLPGMGALGGMLVPALVYLSLTYHDELAVNGWAIPTATDIAFALGVLTLLGSKVPASLKLFLTSLAIFDDIGAIIIIAIFYTSKISMLSLSVALCCITVLFILNRRGVVDRSVYIAVGLVMWVALLKSGVHATLSGVILALFIPIKSAEDVNFSPLKSMERDLHHLVALGILPIFAFCNSGVALIGVPMEHVFHPVPVGITLGLFIGKQIGVFGFCWLSIKTGIARLPAGVSWLSLYGVAVLCGIGFTMSLFIGSLAFEDSGINKIFNERLGIVTGSLLSGFIGYLILRVSLSAKPN